MKFVKAINGAGIAATIMAPKDLDTGSAYSIRNVASTIAHDTMKYYNGNVSSDPMMVGDLNEPYYWWVGGSLWGAMLDYYHYTKDPSYNDVIIEALTHEANTGPKFDFVPENHAHEEGNDDLFFWGSAVIAAAERNFPQPKESVPSWLELGANVFDSLKSRWDETACGGGLRWQIYASNPNGLNYKNSVSNGGFFQIAARMARATGDAEYLEWAEKIWDWSWKVGFIDNDSYHIWDGADSSDNCQKINRVSFTYTSGVYLHGAAVLAEYTGDSKWAQRAESLLDGTGWFFSPFSNATDILYEGACETVNRCTVDMTTHKGQLARFMWQASVMLPSLREKVEKQLTASAKGAAAGCSGGDSGNECGLTWYTGSHDGTRGLGQQMSALETIQGLLIHKAPAPLAAKDIKTVRETNWKPLATTDREAKEKKSERRSSLRQRRAFRG